MTKAVAKKEEAGLPAFIDFGADAGAGFEEADSDSYAIPFLRQLQALSPQVKKKDPEYIKGAEEGDFLNTVSEKVYPGDDGVVIIPVHFSHKFNLWAPDRGGFRGSLTVAEYATAKKSVDQKTGVETHVESGNDISDTREHYVIIVSADGSLEPALLALTGSQIKKSKKWMTQMQNIRIGGNIVPMFSQMYKLLSTAESNDQGSWAGVKFEHLGSVETQEAYDFAKSFRDMVKTGAAKAVHEEPANNTDEDEVPY